jgi:hypothetical protein
MSDAKYMSVADKAGALVRCISSKTKKQTSMSKKSIVHVFTPEESGAMMKEFF